MDTKAIIDHIVNWLVSYNKKAGTGGLVVGVSGGIDSAVTSALAARTGLPVLCVEMPIHQNQTQASRAREHIQHLAKAYPNVAATEVDLTDTYEKLLESMPPQEQDGEAVEMARINSRARLRMTSLYYFAAAQGKLVTGTGNKVEDFGVGFFTKYGDGGVDISPIADLLKTEVYALGRALDIKDAILEAAPTDGLWEDDRNDEDQLGASYQELEWAMARYEEGARKEDFSGREREVFEIYSRLHRINLHKMKPIPVCEIPTRMKG